MATRDTAFETVEVLQDRIGFVEPLAERPMEKRELVEELDVSRSTVDRATRELENAGLVRYSDGSFELTSLGQTATAEFSGVLESIQLRQWLKPFLEWIPDSEFDAELEWFQDAELLVPELGDPYSMINRHVNLIRETEYTRVVLPLCGLHAFEAVHQRVVDEGGRVKGIVTPSVAETTQSAPGFAELTEELIPTGRFEVSVYDDSIPYFLGLFEETVQIGVDEDGEPRAILESDSKKVYKWAEQKYEEYDERSTPVIP